MIKKRCILVLIVFVFVNKVIYAQNKYALLIGINEYQIKDSTGKTVLDPKNALFGCVNDALSMRDVLIKKYNFPSNNITTLLNTKASRVNILKQIDVLLSKCKSGDVAVVYFAGHGMPYRYGNGTDDIAEVILPSNAFATMPFSCIQQAELAKKFNFFVDKNITLTAIFDCCFSLATSSRGSLMIPETKPTKDSLITDLSNDDNWTEPPLPIEPQDADEYELLPNDSVLNAEIVVSDQPAAAIQNRGLSLSQYQEMTRYVLPFGFTYADTTFNPPSQREGSQFIFISATNDMQIAPEMRDENGKKRGAFTLALTKVIETQPSTLSFKEIFNKTVIQLKTFGKEITPSARFKPKQRENKNLFGLPSAELKLKVFISNEDYTYNDLNAIYKNWILPLADSIYQKQAFTKTNPNCSKVYIINQGKSVYYINAKTKKGLILSSPETLKKYLKNQAYVFYLPVPKIINDALRTECLKNKQIELVSDLSKADLSVYCTNYTPNKKNIIDKALDFGRTITDGIINYDYKDKLSFVGSNETVGVLRNKPGHFYSVNDNVIVPAETEKESIVKKITAWLNKKISK